MFFVAALVICLIIKFRFPKGKSIARININNVRNLNTIGILSFTSEFIYDS